METTSQNVGTLEHPPIKTNGRGNGSGEKSNQQAIERKLVSRLQEAVDDRGRYSYRLKDLAIGYAAGQGCRELAAREKINKTFEQQMGMGLQEYLEEHRLERGLSVDIDKGKGR